MYGSYTFLCVQRDSDVSTMHSREIVHLQWSLRPLPSFGFHGNIICGILRLVLAPLLPFLKFGTCSVSHPLGQRLSL